MDVIMKELFARGERGEMRLTVLFDSGASRSLIRRDAALEISTPKELIIERELTVYVGSLNEIRRR